MRQTGRAMDFELDADQYAFREEVRDFLRANITEELLAERAASEFNRRSKALTEFQHKVGAKGWYGLNWPKEFGGLELGATYLHIMVSEFQYWGAPAPDLTVTSVGPMIMRHGTEQNRKEFLPPISRGELTVAVGYSEPDAGTDLASLRTRAELDGDEWVINGSKIWNSKAQMATHEWLCVRTDPTLPRHRGISVIMVPLNSPGIEVRPLIAWHDYPTNETFFTDVRVPRTNLIGELNSGWEYITGALTLERGALTNAGDLRRAVDDLIALAKVRREDGSRPADDAVVRRRIAQLDAEVEVAVLMGHEASSLLEDHVVPSTLVTAEKIYSSEVRQRIADEAISMFGMSGLLNRRADDSVNNGMYERLYRYAPLHRFGGGTNEVLRDIIAQREYGLPRTPRPAARA
jgi:alkylation response protein AidB-like acyl-CoA dehydrogenase